MKVRLVRFSLLAVALFLATLCFTLAEPSVADAAANDFPGYLTGIVTQPRPQVGQQTQIVFQIGNRSQHTLQLGICNVSASNYNFSPSFINAANQFLDGTGCRVSRTIIPGQNYNYQLNLTALKTGKSILTFSISFKDLTTNQTNTSSTGPLTITTVSQ